MTLANHYLRIPSLPKSFYYLIGRILIGIGQLLIIRVLTSVLKPVEIGKYYLIMSLVSILSVFLINPVLIYITRHFYGWYQAGVGWVAMKKFIAYLIIVGTTVAFFLLILNSLDLVQGQSLQGGLYIFIPLLLVGSAISSYPLELLNIMGKYRLFIVMNNLEIYGRIAAILAFSLICAPMATTVIGAIAFWSLTFSFLSGAMLHRSVKDIRLKKDTFTFGGFKELFNFTWPFSVSVGLYWCQSDGYRFVLQHVSGVEAVGKFVVGFNLGATLMIALDIFFHQLYMPVYYREISAETVDSHTAAWNKYAQTLVKVFIPFGLYIACAGPYLSHWLLDSTYWSLGVYAAFGAISQLFRIFSGSLYNGIILQKQTKSLIIPNLVGAVLVLLGTYLFASRSPIVGTGMVLLLSYAAVCMGLYSKLTKTLHIRLPFAAMFKSLLLVVPICIILVVSYTIGFAALPLLNIVTLLLTGLSMIYIQWVLSGDIWFSREINK